MFRDDDIVVIKVLHTTFSQLGVQETHCLQQIKSVDPDDISHTLRLLVSIYVTVLWPFTRPFHFS
jgi:hypothetical protein